MSEFTVGTRVEIAVQDSEDSYLGRYNGIQAVVGEWEDDGIVVSFLEDIYLVPFPGHGHGLVARDGFYWHTSNLKVIS